MLQRDKAQSQTLSPVKKLLHCATPKYCNRTIKLALVFVKRDKLPAHIATHVERILGTDTTRNVGGQEGDENTAQDTLVAALAKTYRAKF
jgi:hypothetical protein